MGDELSAWSDDPRPDQSTDSTINGIISDIISDSIISDSIINDSIINDSGQHEWNRCSSPTDGGDGPCARR